jgi:hypothetical protein
VRIDVCQTVYNNNEVGIKRIFYAIHLLGLTCNAIPSTTTKNDYTGILHKIDMTTVIGMNHWGYRYCSRMNIKGLRI